MINQIERKQKISKFINADKNLFGICHRLKVLKLSGMTDEKIVDVIHSLELPLKYHMFIMGNYSDILGLKFS